jgi:hypothetical protein
MPPIGTATGMMNRRAGSERNTPGIGVGIDTGSAVACLNNTGIGPSTTTTSVTMGGMTATANTTTQNTILADMARLEMLVQGLLVRTRLAASTAGMSVDEIMRLSLSGGEDEAAAVELLKMAIEMDGRGNGEDNGARRPGNGNGDVDVVMADAGAARGVNGNGNMPRPRPPPPLPVNWRMDGAGDLADESDSSVDWDEWLHMEKLA